MKKAEQGFALLYEVSKAVISDRRLEDILSIVVTQTAAVMGSNICSLMLLNENADELVIKATQSLSEEYRAKPPVKVADSISGRAVHLKKPIAVLDVTREKKYRYPEIARKEGLRSLIAVPMMIKNKVLGVLNCYTCEEHEFTLEETQILKGVAAQAALAIENVRLIGEKLDAQDALETRKKVEQAKRILMRNYQWNEEKAFQILQKESMNQRKLIKQIADAIIVSEQMKRSSDTS